MEIDLDGMKRQKMILHPLLDSNELPDQTSAKGRWFFRELTALIALLESADHHSKVPYRPVALNQG